MANLNPEEQQVINKIKELARSYGTFIGIGVLGAALITGGWNIYQNLQVRNLEEASDLYQNFLQINDTYNGISLEIAADEARRLAEIDAQLEAEENLASGSEETDSTSSTQLPSGFNIDSISSIGDQIEGLDEDAQINTTQEEELRLQRSIQAEFLRSSLDQAANILRQDFASTSYAKFANMRLAALNIQEGDSAAAIERLTWVFSSARNREISRMAGLILSRTLYSNGQADASLNILNSDKMQDVTSPAISELRGDIFRDNEDYDNALAYYQEALQMGGNSDLLNYKISNLSNIFN